MAKSKFYVVWVGRRPGVYDNWPDCQAQTHEYKNPKFCGGFSTRADAEAAFKDDPDKYIGTANKNPNAGKPASSREPRPARAIIADASCPGNPGPVEYRAYLLTGKKKTLLFERGPLAGGTNNIGEFLGLVEALMHAQAHGLDAPVYTDSITAITWLRLGRARPATKPSPDLVDRLREAEAWLAQHPGCKVEWWDSGWGESPADYGRK